MTEATASDAGKYAHLMMLAFLGKTAVHLRDVHGVEPSDPDDHRANAAAHMEAHDVPLDARWFWRGQRFVRPASKAEAGR